jgi:hypothetical protein
LFEENAFQKLVKNLILFNRLVKELDLKNGEDHNKGIRLLHEQIQKLQKEIEISLNEEVFVPLELFEMEQPLQVDQLQNTNQVEPFEGGFVEDHERQGGQSYQQLQQSLELHFQATVLEVVQEVVGGLDQQAEAVEEDF